MEDVLWNGDKQVGKNADRRREYSYSPGPALNNFRCARPHETEQHGRTQLQRQYCDRGAGNVLHGSYLKLRTQFFFAEQSELLYTGRYVPGTSSQTIYIYKQVIVDHKGNIHLGDTHFNTPEPGTLGLLGAGLLTMAGMIRRRFV